MFRKYIKKFYEREDGMETLEMLVVISLAAGMFGIILAVRDMIKESGNDSIQTMNGYVTQE